MKKGIAELMALAVILTGCSGSSQLFPASATAKSDTAGPYINMTTYSFTTAVNQPIDFSNITGYDDVDGMMPVTLKGYVNYGKAGEYYPSLVCTDTSGNETSITITIDVIDTPFASEEPAEQQDDQPTPTPTPSTCEGRPAKDASLPCAVVIDADLAPYTTVYEGEEGRTACESAAASLNAAKADSAACEVIQRNDGSFWGYGLKKQ